jgi:hypothetical protein
VIDRHLKRQYRAERKAGGMDHDRDKVDEMVLDCGPAGRILSI